MLYDLNELQQFLKKQAILDPEIAMNVSRMGHVVLSNHNCGLQGLAVILSDTTSQGQNLAELITALTLSSEVVQCDMEYTVRNSI